MAKKLVGVDSSKSTLPYSPAVETDGVFYTSGMLPIDAVTGEIVGGDVKAQTRQVLENLDALLKLGGYTRADVVKTTVFMTDLSHFAVMNELYAAFFEKNFPARTTIEVGALPRGAMVEIELVARK